MHGHLAAHLDPLGSEPVGDPALEPERLIPKLTPELQARIPASLLRLYVPARDARRRAPAPARDLLRDDRLRDRAPLRPRAPRLAAQGDRVGEVPPAAFRRRAEAPARAPDRGRGDGALPPPRLPRPEVVLDRGPRRDGADARRGDRALRRGGGARGRDRHGAPRPALRPRAHARPAVRGDPARVRGRADDRGRRRRPPKAAPATSSTTSAPRASARPTAGEITVALCANPSHLEAVDPVVEGRARAEQTDRSTRAGVHDPACRAADPDPRRRRVRRPGRRRRDPQPRGPRRLHDRRHAPPDREQPGRLHDRPRRGPFDPLLERPGEGLRRPDHPRQRRRPRGGDLGDPARARVPPAASGTTSSSTSSATAASATTSRTSPPTRSR